MRGKEGCFLKKETKKLITCIAVPLATGAVSGFFTRNGMKVFARLDKPPLSPPGWLFPVVWTILFIMMGTASWLVASRPESKARNQALTLYGIQLAVNFLWPCFSFLVPAGIHLPVMAASSVGTGILVYRVFAGFSKKAVYLMIPYIYMADVCRISESFYCTVELEKAEIFYKYG